MRKIANYVSRTTLVLLLALSGVVVSTGPAVALVGGEMRDPADCFSGHLCLWEDTYYGGTLGMYNATSTCYNMGVMNNMASSLVNNDSNVRVYDGANCTGSSNTYLGGHSSGTLHLTGWGDRISSFKQI